MFLVKLVAMQIMSWLTAPNPEVEREGNHMSVELIVHITRLRR